MSWWRKLLCRIGRHPEFVSVERLSQSVERVRCPACGREYAVYADMQAMLPYVIVADFYDRHRHGSIRFGIGP